MTENYLFVVTEQFGPRCTARSADRAVRELCDQAIRMTSHVEDAVLTAMLLLAGQVVAHMQYVSDNAIRAGSSPQDADDLGRRLAMAGLTDMLCDPKLRPGPVLPEHARAAIDAGYHEAIRDEWKRERDGTENEAA